jgi:hypothetical protein
MSNIQNITEQFKGLSAEELLTIIAAATAEAKKAVKVVAKAPKEAKEKKGSMPKGVNPPQLDKPRKWVDFVLKRANEVGWPAINVKDTETLPASVERDGKHVFEATGKPLNNKQAMSLSKQYWSRKEAVGTNKELYDEFEAQYVAPEPAAPKEAESESDAESEASVESAPKEKKEKKVKKTEEEKEAEKAAKALAKAQEKEAATLKKAEEKEAEKQRKALEKAAKAAPKPKEEAPKPKEEAPKPKPVAMKLKKVVPKVEELPFNIEADGMVHEWVLQGKKVYVNSDGEMWERSDSDEAGKWMGKYDPSTKVLDTAAEEPLYADEE